MSLVRIALWGPLLIAAALAGGYIYMHDPFARDGSELLQVPLSEEDPALDRVGDLKYLGGLDIPRMGQNIGGLSGLRWDAESGRLLAITDDARWVWLTITEANDELTGIEGIEVGDLVGLQGEVLTGKEAGDSESLTRHSEGGWLIGFERDHRVWRYANLTAVPQPTEIDPKSLLGALADNRGLEALAGDESKLILCAERAVIGETPNCMRQSGSNDETVGLFASPSAVVAQLGGVPTDADMAADGTVYVLFRSYSPAEGNSASIVAYRPDQTRHVLTSIQPPLTLDNFEGLAVREEGAGSAKRPFIYIVSDDNFSGSQRTLLMKFELVSND